MTTAGLRYAAVAAMLLLAPGARANGQTDGSMSGAPSEARAVQEADSLRRAILELATFVGFSDAPCAPGDIRMYERDTTGAVHGLFRRLELLVASYGAYGSLDNDAGRALLRAVARLETGGPGPRWDVLSGNAPRAFNPLLPATLQNPVTKACEDTPGTPPFGLILPQVTGFIPPTDSGAATYLIEYGPDGVKRVRDAFVSLYRNDSTAVLRHVRVNAHALWGDYAIIGVQRDVEERGVIPLERQRSGAAYAFHRVGGEWRLLAVMRNW